MTPADGGAIYDGEVMHHRFRPRRHRFVYRVQSFLFDIDQLQQVDQRCRWFSLNRFNLYSLDYRDFGDGSGAPLRDYLEQTLRKQGFTQTLHRASLLCYPKVLGYCFNPLSIYYCYGEDDRVFAILYEVSNTFSQRHSYLFPVSDGHSSDRHFRQTCAKNFYVSPFINMDCRYHFRLSPPNETLLVAIRQTENDQALLHALFRGVRRPLSDRELLKGFLRMPLMTVKVMAAIHWEALRLFLKGIKLVPRPTEPSASISRIDE